MSERDIRKIFPVHPPSSEDSARPSSFAQGSQMGSPDSKTTNEILNSEPLLFTSKASSIADRSLKELESSGKKVLLHYPRPIALSKLLEETAQWSDYTFIMDPQLDREIQIFAPHHISREKAFSLVIASTENAGLRMIELENKIIKIVPAGSPKIAV